jgi:hypothetical protein
MQGPEQQKIDRKKLETQHSVSMNNMNNTSLGGSGEVSKSNDTTVMDS